MCKIAGYYTTIYNNEFTIIITLIRAVMSHLIDRCSPFKWILYFNQKICIIILLHILYRYINVIACSLCAVMATIFCLEIDGL